MKKIFIISLLLVFVLCSCNKTTKDDNTTKETKTNNTTETTKEIETKTSIDSEAAINNFLDKLNEFKYNITSENFLTISVYSTTLVYYDYAYYLDEAYVTVNGDETFKAVIDDDNQYELKFFNEGIAVDTLYELLPNYWIDYAGNNIWNILTNSTDNPLEFTFMNDPFIKESIGTRYLGLGQTAVAGIKEMVLVLDKENPSTATISVKYIDNGQLSPTEENRTIIISFDITRPESIATDEWVNNNDREYPAVKNEWDDEDITCFNIVFNQGYNVNDLMPFPDFVSYSFILDHDALYYDGVLEFRDKHATIDDVNAYITSLTTEHGFTKVQEKDINGQTKKAYHKQIDDFGDGYYAYSSIYFEYNNGVKIIVRKYYNYKEYEGLDTTNTLISDKNFDSLESSSNILKVTSIDHTYEYIEGLANLFTYDLVLDVKMEFSEEADVSSYINGYLSGLLEEGYKYNEDQTMVTFESEEYKNTVIFSANTITNELMLQFKSERFITDSEIGDKLVESRFPRMDLSNIDSVCKNITPLYKILYGQVHKNVYLITLSFETLEERNAFLVDYVDNKIMNSGFDFVSPDYARVPHKSLAYYNETEKLILCFNTPNDSLSVSLQLIECSSDFMPLED